MTLYTVSYVYNQNGAVLRQVMDELGIVSLAKRLAKADERCNNGALYQSLISENSPGTLLGRSILMLRVIWETTVEEIVQSDLST